MKTTLLLLASVFLIPMAFTSCSTRAGTAVAGAATYKAIDDHREEEKREDYARAKYYQQQSKKR